MGRRLYGISPSQINRMISASRAASSRRERVELINRQRGIETEKGPFYSIVSSDFNNDSRVAHIDFEELKEYRKISKYVTQDGVRYPVYSGWNSKTKIIKKTIKLTNETLEKLNENSDFLISDFCHEIVAEVVGNEELYPSWFIEDAIKSECVDRVNETKNNYHKLIEKEESNINNYIKDKTKLDGYVLTLRIELEESNKKINKLSKSILKAKQRKKYLLFAILSFGVYGFLHSKKRIINLEQKLENKTKENETIKNKIADKNHEIEEIIAKLDSSHTNVFSLNCAMDKEVAKINKKYSNLIEQIVPLPTSIISMEQTGFISLKKLVGMNYEKIVGCYVIHNIEKDKYYVGQSKDVMKRVTKQHFDGLSIKNIIFAEDYFTSQLENKDDLFEVKIIRLQTKDELDRTEKELIEEYDSFKNGYNGTNGNK